MNALAQVVVRFAVATALMASSYWVMYGSSGIPWIISTILHIYAVSALGVTALLIYQTASRVMDGALRTFMPLKSCTSIISSETPPHRANMPNCGSASCMKKNGFK